MDQPALKTLEYEKIRERLAERTSSIRGRELVAVLEPTSVRAQVDSNLDLTEAAVDILRATSAVSFGGVRDLRSILGRARLGGSLSGEELLAVGSTLRAVRLMKGFFADLPVEAGALQGWADSLVVLRNAEVAIERSIDDAGLVKDEASDELARVRRDIRITQGRLKEKLESILRSAQYKTYFQDTLYTMRGDRYVVPIKQEYRHQFPGIVHDQSSSGATVFIEPMPLVNLNNDLKTLAATEQTEIEKVLQMLAGMVAMDVESMELDCDIMAQLDFTFAKARLALEMKAYRPAFSEKGRVRLRRARHPLIPAATVVPVDIELGGEFATLLVTGPNTGGKTVVLKTLGLLTLMLQSGLFVPAAPESETVLFENVFADIGDEQSIEQSLSTFSGHMTNIVRILGRLTSNSLVLIDEIGAGTDPEEGTALAMAILEHLHNEGALTIATTHYGELKAFAYTRPGVQNACVEFDIETLQPTYRLLTGIPGSSNAFAISRRIGLASQLVDRAQSLVGGEHQHFETVLSAMEAQKKAGEQDRQESAVLRSEAERLRQALQKEKESFEVKKREIISKARSQADDVLREARHEAEEIIAELKKQFAGKGGAALQGSVDQARRRLRESIADANPMDNEPDGFSVRDDVAPTVGDTVFVRSFGQQGVVESADGDSFSVRFGSMKTIVPKDQCAVVAGKGPEKTQRSRAGGGGLSVAKVQSVSKEIDIRGTNNEEAQYILEKYIDDAVLAGLDSVMVIHGKGTGALKKGVRAFLKEHPRVKNVSIAEQNQGGDGASVVKLK